MVVAKELDRLLGPTATPAIAEDLALLRDQVARCRGILSKLTSLGEDNEEGEGFLQTVTFGHVVEEWWRPARARHRGAVTKQGEGPEPVCRRNPGVMFGLANIVDNAVDFADSRVEIEARWNLDRVWLTIRDDGPASPARCCCGPASPT